METSRLGSRRGGLLWLITIMTACFAMLQTQAQAQSAYPPTNRPWNPGDYRALQASIKSGKAKLPSLSDPATKAVFERMIAKDNTPLHVISIKGVPMAGAQILEISGVSDTLKSLIEVYAQQAPQSESVATDVAKLQLYMFKLMDAAAARSDAIKRGLPRDGNYEQQLTRLQQAWRTFGQEILNRNIYALFAGTKVYSKKAAIEMVQALMKRSATILKVLNDQDRAGLAETVRVQSKVIKDDDVKAAFARLQTAFAK